MDYTKTLMYSEIAQFSAALNEIKTANSKAIKELAAEIKSRNIRFITGAARGTSGHALMLLKHLAEIYSGQSVSIAACSVVTVYDGKVDYSGQLVIGVSQSGKAADVLEILNRAKSQGALTLAVTNNTQSPMARAADYHLYCACGEEKSVAATKTFSAQSYLLAWLVAEISGSERLKTALECANSANLGALNEVAGNFAKQLVKDANGFVLSRGITYPIALEAALKLQETCYMGVKAYSFSEFQHGPMAMVGQGTPIIFLAPDAPYLPDLLEVAKKLSGFGGEVHIVTNSKMVEEQAKGFAKVYEVGAQGEESALFVFTQFIQLLACRLACLKGNNPDAPRALNKVTITK